MSKNARSPQCEVDVVVRQGQGKFVEGKVRSHTPVTDQPEPINSTYTALRKATEEDLEAVAEVHRNSIRTLCSRCYTPVQITSWTGMLIPSVYRPALEAKTFLVAEDNAGNIAGFGMLDLSAMEINAIYVAPERGGCGYGRALLQELERGAWEAGAETLRVHSTQNATGFYHRHGYRELASAIHSLPDGTRLECVEMLKDCPASIRRT